MLLPGRIPDIDFRGNDSPKAILANINAQFSTNRVGDPCYCCEISAFAALLVKEELAGRLIQHKLHNQQLKKRTHQLKTPWR